MECFKEPATGINQIFPFQYICHISSVFDHINRRSIPVRDTTLFNLKVCLCFLITPNKNDAQGVEGGIHVSLVWALTPKTDRVT